MARLTICADCGEAGPWLAADRRAVRCPDCTLAFDARRNASRPHYGLGWPAIRRAALRRSGGRCEWPGCMRTDVQVHHVSPRHLDQGVAVLCTDHHQGVHHR